MLTPRSWDRLVRTSWCLGDGVAWFAAIYIATWIRYSFDIRPVINGSTLTVALVAAVVHMAFGYIAGPYRKGHQRGSFEEVVDLATTVFFVGLAVLVWALVARPIVVPRTVPVVAAMVAALMMMAARFLVRAARQHKWLREVAKERVLVYGAGQSGRLLVRNLLADPTSPYLPVAFIDDDPKKRRLKVESVPVKGNRSRIGAVAENYEVDTLIIAMPSAAPETIREISQIAGQAGLKARVVPPIGSLMGHQPTSRDIRDINLEDLLGRRAVRLDESGISHFLGGKRVLVTGAGGSIGSELCRQIARFNPASLVLLDRDESAMHSVQLDLDGNGLLQSDHIVLADIRDAERMNEVFAELRPEIVFHAAALKHLPLLERYPSEAWKTNVLGTMNVLLAAESVGVEAFVNISTDKAADPVCVLGYSKRVAERLTAQVAARAPGRFMSVRFGNVLGSRGSVIPAFTRQIAKGGPVTVTHPEVERYFMLIPEACQLVMQAGVMGGAGEVMVLDMGEPVKIRDLARTLIELSGRTDVDIVYSGLRPGEKLSEDLFNRSDAARPTRHPLVSATSVPPLPFAGLRAAAGRGQAEQLRWLAEGMDVNDGELANQRPHLSAV